MKEDYNRIQELALAQKKFLKMQQWVHDKLPTFYLKIAPEYMDCDVLKTWRTSSDSVK